MGTLAAGIKEIFATAKNTGSNVMLCGNDGTPDGHMTMANLASVLGGMDVGLLLRDSGLNHQTDANLITNTGAYRVSDATVNVPVTSNGAWILCFTHVNGYYMQLYITRTAEMYTRSCNNGTWDNWKLVTTDMPSFYKNYNSLASLASALGVSGFRFETGVSDSTKNPGGSTSFHDHVFLLNSGGNGIEFASETFGDNIYYRMWYNNAPTSGKNWKKFTVSII